MKRNFGYHGTSEMYFAFGRDMNLWGLEGRSIVGRILKMTLPRFQSPGFSNTNLGTALEGFYKCN